MRTKKIFIPLSIFAAVLLACLVGVCAYIDNSTSDDRDDEEDYDDIEKELEAMNYWPDVDSNDDFFDESVSSSDDNSDDTSNDEAYSNNFIEEVKEILSANKTNN